MDSAASAKTVRVTIFNQPYNLAVTGDAGDVEELANSVDELMTQVAAAQRASSLDTARVAVLTCLHLADRLRGVERELSELKSRVGAKSREFSILLDAALK